MMSRTVTALFATRSEAEAAKAKLASDVKVEMARVLARDTVAALDGLSLDPGKASACRQALQGGDHLLVATVARGEKPARIIDSLKSARPAEPESDEPKLSYEIGALPGADAVSAHPEPVLPPEASEAPPTAVEPPAEPAAVAPSVEEPATPVPSPAVAPVDPRPNQAAEVRDERPEVRIGDQRVVRGQSAAGASDSSDPNEFESRTPARRLTDQEVEASGLLRDRVIEVVEMREEPIIAREVVVREEVIIRKTVEERTETVNDTVRRTEVNIEELR